MACLLSSIGTSGTAATGRLARRGAQSARAGWLARREHVGSAVETDDVEVALGVERPTKVAVCDDDPLRVIQSGPAITSPPGDTMHAPAAKDAIAVGQPHRELIRESAAGMNCGSQIVTSIHPVEHTHAGVSLLDALKRNGVGPRVIGSLEHGQDELGPGRIVS